MLEPSNADARTIAGTKPLIRFPMSVSTLFCTRPPVGPLPPAIDSSPRKHARCRNRAAGPPQPFLLGAPRASRAAVDAAIPNPYHASGAASGNALPWAYPWKRANDDTMVTPAAQGTYPVASFLHCTLPVMYGHQFRSAMKPATAP
jgi:hypothetical protein